jgi:hypothetical protein
MTVGKSLSPPGGGDVARERSSRGELDAFLDAVRRIQPSAGAGRLILAIDATMSRQPTWDMACEVQGRMFDAVAATGGLNVQLVYFRGFRECRASRFAADAAQLRSYMTGIACHAGRTQIGKVLDHVLREHKRKRVNALVYIGDALEELIDTLAHSAGELGLRGVPVFIFQEGPDGQAEAGFREIARLSRGAWFRFDRSSPETLGKLLSSIAVYATGGTRALRLRGRPEDRRLLERLGPAAGA